MKYLGNESLIISKPSIALIGAGGSGSFMFRELLGLNSLLSRIGGNGFIVSVFDPNSVREANLGRQAFFDDELGLNKAEALVSSEQMQGRCGDWLAFSKKFDIQTANKYDVVITAVDVPRVRYELGKYWASKTINKKTLWLDLGNDDCSGQTILGNLGNDVDVNGLRLPNCYDLYNESYNVDSDDKKSCSLDDAILKQNYGVNQMAARIAAQLLTNLFRNGEIDVHGAFFNCITMTTTPLLIDPTAWKMFGYNYPSVLIS
ncbi:PRTRC system ThiF family protein [Photobacterium kishitanii]|uniref:PRTRC system ThiF family protein n=1 Tax=Photobacterium kishitanii TaxID=318456 RepID=A0AAX0YRE5_9GAMM|nr:PRTRC system ThiF family protein [Photobacterium kishitanii]PSX18354.1 PRTRC system ThiF family protein [Photobacterium kishitanii]PSX26855.1 PRTRC system ThiF family protein [Photobacterium kishitanii]PSX31141.1 PRTRC system ThiF family protein [Photobacterium kishitanii]PSX44090.1 PRTRC system ThiF family protein [Photobacterium kishitanii]